jgi:hypothetical protein
MALARKRGPEDRSRINLSEHYEIDFWINRFECSEAELRDAVNRLGTCAHVVKSFLRNRKLRGQTPSDESHLRFAATPATMPSLGCDHRHSLELLQRAGSRRR